MVDTERNFYKSFLSFQKKRYHFISTSAASAFPQMSFLLVKNLPKICFPENSIACVISTQRLVSNTLEVCQAVFICLVMCFYFCNDGKLQ